MTNVTSFRALSLCLATALLAVPPLAAQRPAMPGSDSAGHQGDDMPHPLGAKQRYLRNQAVKDKVNGKANGRIHRLAGGQYVELEIVRVDRIFVILAEFGNAIHPDFGGTPGPLHNQIPQPDPAIDNVSLWQPNFNQSHYQDMVFSKMADYYRSQSSGRYGFTGAATDWVKVPYNEARYGKRLCAARVCENTWALIQDAVNSWTADRIAQGWTPGQVRAYLDTFDRVDRFDFDGDGNYDEPDGYIDRFVIVHAGRGREFGGGAQGLDAIGSHNWYAHYNQIGSTGPPYNKAGGVEFGSTGIWAANYSMIAEDSGVGVFAHEYGHDLGLPDSYDTANGGDTATGFWTLMSSGSSSGSQGLTSTPTDLNAWEKLMLGWLDYDLAYPGKRSSHRLGPAETNTKSPQAVIVLLPDKQVEIAMGTPPEGTRAWWSGRSDFLDSSMTRSITVPAVSPKLQMQLWYEIELDYDYAYVEVSANGGASFTSLAGNVTTTYNKYGQNLGNGITGWSAGAWVPATFDLSAYAGQTVLLRLRYVTDMAILGKGLLADSITVGSFSDGAESGNNGWTVNGFKASTGTEFSFYPHAYFAEFRQYRGYDAALRTGPYYMSISPNRMRNFPYQDGLLVSYWNGSIPDNSVSTHPGEGLILPVDAHPEPLIHSPSGFWWRVDIQTSDSTFGLEPTDGLILKLDAPWNPPGWNEPQIYPSLPAVPEFNDLNTYWYPSMPTGSVIVPKTGTRIRVVNVSTQGNFMEVLVN